MLSLQFRDINGNLYYFSFLYLFMFAGLSILWNVYFVKRILYLIPLYRKSTREAKTDIFDNSSDRALHYRVEVVKYALLLAINITEITVILIDQLGLMMTHIKWSNTTLNNCMSGNAISNTDFHAILGNPLTIVFIAIGQVGLILTLALGTSLMKYLDAFYHNINDKSLKSAKMIIVVSCVIGVLLLIMGSIPQLFIPQKILFPIITLLYFCIWTKQARTFYKTLNWRSVEFKIRGRSSRIVKRAVNSSYYFGITISLLGIGLFSVILADLLDEYFFLFAAFAYCPNIIHQIYDSPDYEPLLTARPQMAAFTLCSGIIAGTSTALSIVAFLTVSSQYLFATFVFFGGILVKKLNYRFGRVRTRFTPNLRFPLLIA